jgi:hypothetical protein
MPKAKPDMVHVVRIELQEKEREFLETLQATQSMKNLGYTAAAVGVTAIGYLGWKTYHEAMTGEEPSIFNVLTKEGRAGLVQNVREKPAGTFWKLFFDPLGFNPFI